MFERLRKLYREFDEEVLKKEEYAEKTKPNPQVKQQYEKAEFDFKGER